MAALDIKASKRTALGKGVASLRKGGEMPAVVYGPKQESTPITLNTREFEKLFKMAGESTVINVSIDGESVPTLIHEVDHDPLTGTIRHADFYAIVKGQKVQVKVPLTFTGESVAVRDLGANFVKIMHELEVEADPMNLPHELTADISPLLVIGDHVLAKDVVLPAGVVLIEKPDEVVAIAAAANQEEVVEAPAEVDMAAIGDAVERGKKEEEIIAGAEGETPAA
ncbi:MAG: 50S ribosomal protein L25 [Patescibacteria group bacterium]